MAQTNFNPFADMFKMLNEHNVVNMWGKMPAFDMQHVMSMQQSNTETIKAASQTMAETVTSMIKLQVSQSQAQASNALNLIKEVSNVSNPEAGLHKTVSFVKNSVENLATNTHQAMEIATKSSMEVFDLLSQKMSENLSQYMSTCSGAKTKVA